jgi:hypothetical protein
MRSSVSDIPGAEASVALPVSPWQRLLRVVPFEPEDVPDVQLSDAQLLARLADCEALVSQVSVRQSRLLVELRRRRLLAQAAEHPHDGGVCVGACCEDDGWVALEVGLQLGLSERQVQGRLDTAHRLARYRHVERVLHDGLLQSWTATKLLEHLDTLAAYVGPARLEHVEQTTLTWLLARPRTVTQLNARMRRIILIARAAAEPDPRQPEGPDGAGPPGQADRRVWIGPASTSGLAEVVALLPEADALAIRATLYALAHDRVDADDTRTTQQRRADLLVTMITGGTARCGHPGDPRCSLRDAADLTVRLDVTVPATALTGGPQPAHVPGYGDIPATTARDLAAGTGCQARPLVYDPQTGRLLGFAATGMRMTWLDDVPAGRGYVHPPTLRTAVSLRDGTCRAPGCRRPAARCDCDHATAFPVGPTTLGNSCSLCRRHHRLKTHAPGWHMTMTPDGEVIWTTPTGTKVTTEPADYRPPDLDPAPPSPDESPPF